MKKLSGFYSPDRWFIVPVHYSADPEKATPEWYENQRINYRDDGVWEREFEINFTSRKGQPCYRFGVRHVVRGLEVKSYLPLCLCMDFNFSPMVWTIAQIENGWINFIEQVYQRGASVESMTQEFRNRYPTHQGGLRIYGDATGSSSDGHAGKSYYDLFRLAMRGWPDPVEFRVPVKNPRHAVRVNAVNVKLDAADGAPGIRVDPDGCPDLVEDFSEVVWKQKTKPARGSSGDVEILKVSDPSDPYFWRTHSTDGVGYFIVREFPVGMVVAQTYAPKKKSARPNPKYVIGAAI